MNIYELSRSWFDFAFKNPHKIKPIHGIIFFFAIEHCNRLGWKSIFGFPTSMVLEATGIKSYSSYKKHFDELVGFGFIKVHEYSKNQYSSNIIELSLNVKAEVKALDKALVKHASKQHQSTSQSNCSIDKQYTSIQINNLYNENDFLLDWSKCRTEFIKKPTNIKKLDFQERISFADALKNYSDREVKDAMVCLFKQEVKNISAMFLRPKHFLESIDKYVSASTAKDYKLYGSIKKINSGAL